MDVSQELIDRLKGAPEEKAADEGIAICIEAIQRLKEIEGVRGVHIMAIEREEKAPELVKGTGLHPRPEV